MRNVKGKKFVKDISGCMRLLIFLLTLTLSGSPAGAAEQIDLVGPTGSGRFGVFVKVLPNGDSVVIDPL